MRFDEALKRLESSDLFAFECTPFRNRRFRFTKRGDTLTIREDRGGNVWTEHNLKLVRVFIIPLSHTNVRLGGVPLTKTMNVKIHDDSNQPVFTLSNVRAGTKVDIIYGDAISAP